VLSDEPLDAALADAVPLRQHPLRRAGHEGDHKLLGVGFTQPVTDPPLMGYSGAQSGRSALRPLSAPAPAEAAAPR
jgi:hypothetical protein